MLDAINVDEVTYDVSVVINSESCCEGGAGHIERRRRSAAVEETMLLSRRINELTDDLPGSTAIEDVFARNQILFEPREISTADDVTVRYHTWLHAQTSLDDLNLQLMTEGAGVKSVIWEHPKQRDLA